MPLVLCEGVFDAIAIRRNAVPLLGKFVPRKLLKMMIKNKVKEVYVALDDDAITEAREIERARRNPEGMEAKFRKATGKPFKSGGKVSSASKRADGCCTKGKTKGRMV